jgi:predicted O-methyltransferase YrrM
MSLTKKICKLVFENIPLLQRYNLRLSRLVLEEIESRHVELSGLLSMDDSQGAANDKLLDVSHSIIDRARKTSLPLLKERCAPDLVHVWPGEHYKLLSALVEELKPTTILEIGTFTGLSALAMLPVLPKDSKLITFDIVPWKEIENTYFQAKDFEDARFSQIVSDLTQMANAKKYESLLQTADFIFIDAAKDGMMEKKLFENLREVGLKKNALLMFDDIRLWNMLAFWHEITYPKLDLTSFGHWTGTGLLDWDVD